MQKRKKFVTAVVSNTAGEIFDLDGYAAVGMAGVFSGSFDIG